MTLEPLTVRALGLLSVARKRSAQRIRRARKSGKVWGLQGGGMMPTDVGASRMHIEGMARPLLKRVPEGMRGLAQV